MNDIKYFICPMSKNITDAILELNDKRIGLLPSRRQIDFNGGYTGWTTSTFSSYINKQNVIERDHGGPGQGAVDDDGITSFEEDSKYFDIIHIDPWKKYKDFNVGIAKTIDIIRYVYNKNPNVKYEIGTEQALRPLENKQIRTMLEILSTELPTYAFNNIMYVVVQSGVGLDLINSVNTGHFNYERLVQDISLCNSFGKLSKEHNGDFLNEEQHRTRFQAGLSAINIGPEFSLMETELYLNHMNDKDIDDFYTVCLNSKRWEKWVSPDFDVTNKLAIIKICGHYNYNSFKLPDISHIVKQTIKDKLQTLLTYAK
jgi:hypothetical protein